MGKAEGIPSRTVGTFPVNLIGKEMVFWRLNNLPYPEEICMMWDELWWAAAWQYQDKLPKDFPGRYHTPYWGHEAFELIEKDVMTDLGLLDYERSHFFDPLNWHAGLREGRRDMNIRFKPETGMPPPKNTITYVPPTPPNPPRVAQLQVQHTSSTGQKTVFPLISTGLVLLKENGNWKYNDSATIAADKLDDLIRELTELKYRLEDNY